ncbi:MAG TPA: OsmC family protein [Vicinamibacteria bacterium]|nr:OsmC family protein [Vicinamibacteria bacterium]
MASQVTVKRIDKFKNEIQIGEHLLLADEPREAGGEGQGPDPYGFLLAALGSCISMTLTLYADRKKWPLLGIEVRLRHAKVYGEDCAECGETDGEAGSLLDRIEKEILLKGPLDEDQKRRLLEIAGRCPVHRTLTGTVVIVDRK